MDLCNGEERPQKMNSGLKVALVVDWLTIYGGAERVVEQMLLCFPEADIFSTIDFIEDKDRNFIQYKETTTSFIQTLPFARKKHRYYVPLMMVAIEQFDLSKYDLIISSSHSIAKGVISGPDQLHVCMCYSPMRYAWDLQHQYLKESGLDCGIKGLIVRWLFHRMRIWDSRTANGVDHFIAISNFISRRIYKIYRRKSFVIYPPVDTEAFSLEAKKEDYYLAVSRMVPYKKMDLIVDAFSKMPDKKLVVIGNGPDYEKISRLAAGNIKLLGFQEFEVLKRYMQKAVGFVFAAEDDFGITPLEAQACGTPVIAFGKGGALESIKGVKVMGKINKETTGVFFSQQSTSSIIDALNFFEENKSQIYPESCRKNAERFSKKRFRNEFSHYIEQLITDSTNTIGQRE